MWRAVTAPAAGSRKDPRTPKRTLRHAARHPLILRDFEEWEDALKSAQCSSSAKRGSTRREAGSAKKEPGRDRVAVTHRLALALGVRSHYFPDIAGLRAAPRRVMMQRLNDQMRLKTGGSPLAASARALKLLLICP